ncbi:hypothetical protein D3C86_2214680 [compost metagenome]
MAWAGVIACTPSGGAAEWGFSVALTVITLLMIGVTHFGRFRYQPENAMVASTGAAKRPPARCSV